MTMLLAVIAIAGAIGCVLMMRTAWARKGGANGWLVGGAWGVAALAAIVWVLYNGDRGFVTGMVIATGLALAFFLPGVVKGVTRPALISPAGLSVPPPATGRPAWVTALRRVWTFLLAGPLAGLAAVLIGAFLFVISQGAGNANAAVLGLVLAPVIWGALGVLMLYDENLVRRTLILGALIAIGASAFLF